MTLDAAIRTIAVPEAPAIPGLLFRHYRGPTDHPAMLEVRNAAHVAGGLNDLTTLEGMDVWYTDLTNCDPREDLVLVELGGRVIAYGRTWWADRTSGERAFEAICFIDPTVRGRGIGTALLAMQDRRRRALAASMGDELDRHPAVLVAYPCGDDPGGVAILEASGYRLARRHAEMLRPDLEAIPDLPVPAGIALRRADPADEGAMRRAFEVDAEVFRDHWGEVDDSPEAWERFRVAPEVQPASWCVAVDVATGEVAGQILNYLAEPAPDGTLIGWTESIAVRRPYRHRGLASAMLAESLRIVRAAGATKAALGVDLESAHGASRIYERLGFRVSVEQGEYHKPYASGEGRP